MTIHPTAIVEDGAHLGEGVVIGPYCVVGPHVHLGDGVELISHVAVAGFTQIGPRTRVWPFASVGHQPQDLKYAGEESRLEIGADCMIREHATLNPGTEGGGMLTTVGDRCLFMMGSHVGHDCRVGSNVVLANNATLAGHVTIEDFAVLGGLSAVLQRMRVGEGAMVGGMAGVENDVIPFGSVIGNRADLGGLNLIGLRRRGVSRDELHVLRRAYTEIFEGPGTLYERTEAVAQSYKGNELVSRITDFILAVPGRRFCTPRES